MMIIFPLGAIDTLQLEKQSDRIRRISLQENTILAENTTLAQKAAEGGRIGIVVSVKGKNFLTREGGEEVLAAPKTSVMVGDEISTSKDGYLQITFVDGSILKLIGKSSVSVNDFVFNEEQGEASGELETDGATFVFLSGKMSKVAPQNFKVKTATATIGIRGSTIDASVGADGMQLTGGGIYADPVAGGATLEFDHDNPVAFEITTDGVEQIPVPPEGGFFASTAQAIFGEEADEITQTQDLEEEEDESLLGATGEEDSGEEENLSDDSILEPDIASLLLEINQFSYDGTSGSEAGDLGYSGKFLSASSGEFDELFLSSDGPGIWFDSSDTNTALSNFKFQSLNNSTVASDHAFLTFSQTGTSPNLGYIGKDIAPEVIDDYSGILSFSSLIAHGQGVGGGSFANSLLATSTGDSFIGNNEIYIDFDHNNLFGIVSFDSELEALTSGPQGVAFTDDEIGFKQTVGLELVGSSPDMIIYSKHQDLKDGAFAADTLLVAQNLGYGVIHDSFKGVHNPDLLGAYALKGEAQLYGDGEIEGIGMSAKDDADNGFIAGSFTLGYTTQDIASPGLVAYEGLTAGLKISLSSVNDIVGYEVQKADQFAFSIDLAQKELDEDSLNFSLDGASLDFVAGTSFVLNQQLAFSALESSNNAWDPKASFLIANPVPVVKDSSSSTGEIVPGVLWGGYNLVEPGSNVLPGKMNFWVAADVTDDAYHVSGSTIIADRLATPLSYYKGSTQRTLVSTELFEAGFGGLGSQDVQAPFFTAEGYSSIVVNYEDETFTHYSIFPDGFLLVGSGDLGAVNLGDSGDSHFGFSSTQWRLVDLMGGHDSSILLSDALSSAASDFPNSSFIGSFAADDAEGLFFSFSREHDNSGDLEAVYGVGAAVKVGTGQIEKNPVITTGYVHGVLVDKVSGAIITDVVEAGKDINFAKQWTDESSDTILDVDLHVNNGVEPAYVSISAVNTDTTLSEARGALVLYSNATGSSNSSSQEYSANISNTQAKLENISYSYTINPKNVIDEFPGSATSNALPFTIVMYAMDDAGKYYYLETEEKTYGSSGDFDNWITEEFDVNNGNIKLLKVDTLAEVEDQATIDATFAALASGGVNPQTMDSWETGGLVIVDASAEVFKVFVRWGDAAYINSSNGANLSLDHFIIEDANDNVVFEDNFNTLPVEESLFIDKNAFYVPFTANSQSIFTPDISGYTKVDGKTVVSGLPGLEDYSYLLWGIWSSEMTEDANPSNVVQAKGFFGGGLVEHLSDPAGYASFASGHNVVNYSGLAIGNVYNLSGNYANFHSGTANITVDFTSNQISSGYVNLGPAKVNFQAGSISISSTGLPFTGNTTLSIDGASASGSGSYHGQFFGNGADYAKEASGSFGATNSTHKVMGAFGVKRN